MDMKVITGEDVKQLDDCFIFIYSRFCGTCHVARSFLDKIENTHQQEVFYEMNASLSPDFLQRFKIESVPCLLIMKDGIVKEKVYTFYSVWNIYHYLYKYKPELFSVI